MHSSLGSFDGSNEGAPAGLLLGYIIGSTDKSPLVPTYGVSDLANSFMNEGLILCVSLKFTIGIVLGFDKNIPLGYTDGELIYSKVVVDDEDTLGTDEGTEVGYTLSTALGLTLGVPYGYNDSMLEISAVGVTLRSTDKFVLGSDEGINHGSTDCELLGSTLGVEYGNTLSIDEEVNLGSPYVSFDGSNEGVPEVSLLGYTLGSTDSL